MNSGRGLNLLILINPSEPFLIKLAVIKDKISNAMQYYLLHLVRLVCLLSFLVLH